MEAKTILNKLMDGYDLSQKETSFLLEKIIQAEINPAQIAAVLAVLRFKGETVEEIVGFIKCLRKHMIKINASKAIDIVGTGGDGIETFNISTAASFVVAGCGIPVAKHGNRAASSRCGSADVLEALGVNINLKPKQAENVFKKVGMVFLFAPNFHPAFKQIAPIRKELKIRTIFNFLGPFLNPAQTKIQLVGIPNIKIAEKLSKVASKLKFKKLFLITSKDGLDEITTTTETKVFEIEEAKIKAYEISPNQYGIKYSKMKDLLGGNAVENASIIKEILKGKKCPKREIVVLNSAVALQIFGKVKSIAEGILLAERSIDSGAALRILKNLISQTQKYA